MNANELVSLVKRSNARKRELEKEALAIAHAVVEKALAPVPPEIKEKEDGTRRILMEKYHVRKPEN